MARIFLALPNTGTVVTSLLSSIMLASKQPRAREQITQSETHIPQDWWQAFRGQWMPGWWLNRYPVKTSSFITENVVYVPSGHQVEIISRAFSAVTGNFNALWCDALNLRAKAPFDYYAMIHQDVNVEPGWLDTMVDEMVRTGADVLSVICPIKDTHGLSSSGVFRGNMHEGVRRFTLKELHEELPETFSIEDIGESWKGTKTHGLAVNNSLWMCRFDQPWVQEVTFTMSDWIYQVPVDGEDPRTDENGIEHGVEYHMGCESDDWTFSRWCHRRGLKVFVTRKIPLGHIGPFEFRNDHVWGDWETEMCGR